MKNKNTGGIAMGMVLIFITAILALGGGLLLLSRINMVNSAAMKLAIQNYYDAESAVLVADFMFINGADGATRLDIPTHRTGAIGTTAGVLRDDLIDALDIRRDDVIKYFNGLGISIEFEHVAPPHIITRQYRQNEEISFFSSGLGDDADNDGYVEVIGADIVTYVIRATQGRTAEIRRTIAVDDGARFKPAVMNNNTIDADKLLNFGYLAIITNPNPNQWLTSDVGVSVAGQPPHSPTDLQTTPIFGTSFDEIMRSDSVGGHVNFNDESQRVGGIVLGRMRDVAGATGDTLRYLSAPPQTTPPTVREVTATTSLAPDDLSGIRSLWAANDLTLVGDFPDLEFIHSRGNVTLAGDFHRLNAVYVYRTINLGNDNRGFSSNRSGAAQPLHIYSRGNGSTINLSRGAVIRNAIIRTGGSTTFTGGICNYEYCGGLGSYCCLIQMDAQFMGYGNMNIGTNSINVVSNNWDSRFMPTFLASNEVNAFVTARPGFSGIIYSTNSNVNVAIDSPEFNGAILAYRAANTFALNNTGPPPAPVYFHFNRDALYNHSSLPLRLESYFNEVGGNGGGGVSRPAEFRYNNLELESTNVTLREITGRPTPTPTP